MEWSVVCCAHLIVDYYYYITLGQESCLAMTVVVDVKDQFSFEKFTEEIK